MNFDINAITRNICLCHKDFIQRKEDKIRYNKNENKKSFLDKTNWREY